MTGLPIGLSRRCVLGGFGAVVGAAATGVVGRTEAASAGHETPRVLAAGPAAAPVTRVVTLGAADFVPANHKSAAEASLSIAANGGLSCNAANLNAVTASVRLPAGSTITKVEAISNPGGSDPEFAFKATNPATQTVTPIASARTAQVNVVTRTVLTVDHVVDPTLSYAVSFTALYGAIALFGVQITYTEPATTEPVTSGFVALNPTPRVFNTRDGGAPKLADREERIVPLAVPARSTAVLNLTITETEGAGGYVACFPADIAWPGNSSINWFGTAQNLANTTVCATDSAGQIRVRGGRAGAHVIIDVIGYLS